MKTLSNSDDRQEIFRRIAQLSSEDQAQWGQMSVHQTLCHLRDSYCVALGEKTASPASSFLQRTLAKWISLWVPVHWMKGYPTRPEIEQGKGGSAPTEFVSDLNGLQTVLSRFCDSLPLPCALHPVFGSMKAHEWLRWGYLHADHHLRQFGR
jgi:Protein of unknown function (DUF1569)